MVFTRSAITPLKVNRFGWNLEQCESNVGCCPWQILGAIRAVATVWEAAEILFFCPINNARFCRFPVGQILRHLNTTTSIGEAENFCNRNFENFTLRGRFTNKTQKLLTKFPCFATSGRHNSAVITDRQKFTSKLTLYGMSSHCVPYFYGTFA